MKKTFLLPVIAVLASVSILASCMKNDDVPQCTGYTLEQDRQIIDSFINANSLNNLSYNSNVGAYLGTVNLGEGSTPAADSLVSYKYTISLMDGKTVGTSDTIKTNNTGSPLKLSDFNNTGIEYLILSALKKGGTGKAILPSSIYFGCQPQTTNDGITIPANSQLIYDFTLTDVKFNK